MQKKSWRDWLRVHPAANDFPLLSETDPEALKELAEDIRKHGLHNPCCLVEDEDGQVALFDGRNRLDALELIGEEITLDNMVVFERFPADSIDVAERVISLNLHRRHLDPRQKREAIAKLIKDDPTKSNRQIAKMVDASHPHVAKVCSELEEAGDVETVTTSIDTAGRRQPLKKRRTRTAILVDKARNVAGVMETARACGEMVAEEAIAVAQQAGLPEDERKELLKAARTVVETAKPDARFIIARWRRTDDAVTIAKCILATLKFERHDHDVTGLRTALEHFLSGSIAPPAEALNGSGRS